MDVFITTLHLLKFKVMTKRSTEDRNCNQLLHTCGGAPYSLDKQLAAWY